MGEADDLSLLELEEDNTTHPPHNQIVHHSSVSPLIRDINSLFTSKPSAHATSFPTSSHTPQTTSLTTKRQPTQQQQNTQYVQKFTQEIQQHTHPPSPIPIKPQYHQNLVKTPFYQPSKQQEYDKHSKDESPPPAAKKLKTQEGFSVIENTNNQKHIVTPSKQQEKQKQQQGEDQQQNKIQTSQEQQKEKGDTLSPVPSQCSPSQQSPLTTRRIPGPAGSLPPLQLFGENNSSSHNVSLSNTEINNDVNSTNDANSEGLMLLIQSKLRKNQIGTLEGGESQESDFTRGSWAIMLKERGLPPFGTETGKLLKCNVGHILEGHFNKVPHLVVLVKALVPTEADFKVVLRDPTGEIKGTLQRKAVDANPLITNGSVIVLDKVSVFIPSPSAHFLNIVAQNITQVYNPENADLARIRTDFKKLTRSYSPKCIYSPDPPQKVIVESKISANPNILKSKRDRPLKSPIPSSPQGGKKTVPKRPRSPTVTTSTLPMHQPQKIQRIQTPQVPPSPQSPPQDPRHPQPQKYQSFPQSPQLQAQTSHHPLQSQTTQQQRAQSTQPQPAQQVPFKQLHLQSQGSNNPLPHSQSPSAASHSASFSSSMITAQKTSPPIFQYAAVPQLAATSLHPSNQTTNPAYLSSNTQLSKSQSSNTTSLFSRPQGLSPPSRIFGRGAGPLTNQQLPAAPGSQISIFNRKTSTSPLKQ